MKNRVFYFLIIIVCTFLYYYKGVENDSGKTIGPVHKGLKTCRSQYFIDYPTSGDNKSAYYVNNKNIVFSLNGKNIESYNN